MLCPYRKNTIYSRNFSSGEIEEIKEFFEDCETTNCPYYSAYYCKCMKVEYELIEINERKKYGGK